MKKDRLRFEPVPQQAERLGKSLLDAAFEVHTLYQLQCVASQRWHSSHGPLNLVLFVFFVVIMKEQL
jgi:hypothetical protein